MRFLLRSIPVLIVAILLGAALAWAGITGSISGVVSDPHGGVMVAATVTAIETQTGVKTESTTDSKGFYNFSSLPIGTYNVEVRSSGFKLYRQTGLVIDVNSELRVDVQLQIGDASEKITVMSEAVHVETDSTQNGEVISGTKMTTVPLNGRAFTDLLSLQPGVIPSSFAKPVQKQFGGLTDRNVSGDLNPGNQSINGQRQSANGFMVNGSNVEEGKNNGAGIVPNLDSIAEFRIITNNFDAEYGNYSGGQVNVVTKSGTNAIHGSVFEFFRNTVLDARNFFAPVNQVDNFKQNQFGAAVGGPLKRDKAFFFLDYQGTRTIRGQVLNNNVPGLPDRPDTNGGSANVTDLAANAAGSVTGANWAAILNQRLGRNDIIAGTPYFGCAAAPGCVFPGNIIPAAAINPAALKLLPFIPKPNGTDASGNPNFASASENARTRDDKGAIRLDGNSRFGTLSAYYLLDDYLRTTPIPTTPSLAGLSALRVSTPSRPDARNWLL